jgi:hypothetical protein
MKKTLTRLVGCTDPILYTHGFLHAFDRSHASAKNRTETYA